MKQKFMALMLLVAILLSMNGCMLLINENDATITVSPATEEGETVIQSDSEYQKKLDEVIALLDQYYIDGYDKTELGDYLAQAAVAASKSEAKRS